MASGCSSTRKFRAKQKVEVLENFSGPVYGYNNWIPSTYHRKNTPVVGLKKYLVVYDHDPREYHFVPTNQVRAKPEKADNVEFNVGNDVEVFRNNMWMEAVVKGKNGNKYDLTVKKDNIDLAGMDKGSIRPKTDWIMGPEKYRKAKPLPTPLPDNNLELN